VPYTLKHKENNGGVIASYSGKVTEKELQQCLEEKLLLGDKNMSHKKTGVPLYFIRDFAETTNFDVSVETVKLSATLYKALMEVNETVLIAVVAPNDHEFGMARLWHAYIGIQDERANVFRTREAASNWIVQTLFLPKKSI
jgi:hypothetical protein